MHSRTTSNVVPEGGRIIHHSSYSLHKLLPEVTKHRPWLDKSARSAAVRDKKKDSPSYVLEAPVED